MRAVAYDSFKFWFLAAVCLLGVVSPGWGKTDPWLERPWRENMSIPAGLWQGAGKQIVVMNRLAVTWLPGSLVERVDLKFEGEARLAAKGSHFRNASIGLGLWARLDVEDCVFESPHFRKVDGWYDKQNSSTKWRFANCVFTKSFMGGEFLVADCSVRGLNCTFIDMKMPSIGYRNNDVVNQAQQDWLKFEKCRFVNCEINERFLLTTINCVFENCRYTGGDKSFSSLVKRPMAVKAYWSGNVKTSYQEGNVKVEFIMVAPPFKCGSTLTWTEKGKQLAVQGVDPMGPAQILGGIKEAPSPSTTETPAPVSPAVASGSSEAVTGTAGAANLPLPKKVSAINALLVVDLPGQGEAGAAAKLSALALPIDPFASSEVLFNQKVGPLMMTALREVVKCIQVRHSGWPRGQRIELAFADKFIPKDGPSAAVACALLLDSMIGNWSIDPTLAITGDLNADGSVQPIGGVAGKIRGATKAGCLRVALPTKNENAVGDLLVLEGGEPLARIEVFTIDTFDSAKALARQAPTSEIDQATELFSNDPQVAPNLPQASLLFKDARRLMLPGGRWDANALRDRNVQAKLREVLRLQPNHVSSKWLLAAAMGTAPVKLSLQGSISAMDDSAVALLQAITSKNVSSMTKIGSDDLGSAVFKLQGARARMDARVYPALDALTNFGKAVRVWQNQPPRTKTTAEKLSATIMSAANEADRQRALLMNNREVVEELMR